MRGDFGDFCRAAARATRAARAGGAAAPLPRVDRYTVWNEPNRGQYLRPQGAHGFEAPKVMAGLMRACAGASRRRPDAEVALGPLASRGGQGGIAPIDFLAPLSRRRRAGPDVVALNPYIGWAAARLPPREPESDGAITLRNLDPLQTALAAAYGATMPIWLTEFAWRTAQHARDRPDHAGAARRSWPRTRSS